MESQDYTMERVRHILKAKNVAWIEKKMFGGNCIMVNDKMCFGTYKGGLMVRVDPKDSEKLIAKKGAEQMIHGGRLMNGYLFIQPEGYDKESDLEFWISECLAFNPKAKSSKKK